MLPSLKHPPLTSIQAATAGGFNWLNIWHGLLSGAHNNSIGSMPPGWL